MALLLFLAKAIGWLRGGYPQGAPRHGYVPLIALMPGAAANVAEQPYAAEISGASISGMAMSISAADLTETWPSR
jgi:Protein of unknown function (DUF3349)